MVGAVVKIDDLVIKSSLFHYVSISPTQEPNWSTFAWLVALGIVMMIIGAIAFSRRDIVSE
jgi:putative exporter of polyketide antibiotics